jgi:hypothetical protein
MSKQLFCCRCFLSSFLPGRHPYQPVILLMHNLQLLLQAGVAESGSGSTAIS